MIPCKGSILTKILCRAVPHRFPPKAITAKLGLTRQRGGDFEQGSGGAFRLSSSLFPVL
jgi:hypothetical protein